MLLLLLFGRSFRGQFCGENWIPHLPKLTGARIAHSGGESISSPLSNLRWMLVVGCGGKFTVKASFVFNSPRGPRTGSLWPVDCLCVLELILGLCLGIEICVDEFRCSLYHPVLK